MTPKKKQRFNKMVEFLTCGAKTKSALDDPKYKEREEARTNKLIGFCLSNCKHSWIYYSEFDLYEAQQVTCRLDCDTQPDQNDLTGFRLEFPLPKKCPFRQQLLKLLK